MSSESCVGSWVENTFAATQCCGPLDPSTPYGRDGRPIPPAVAECAAYASDDAYVHKCGSNTGYEHPLD